MAKKHKMTAGAMSGVGRLEKIGKKPKSIKGEGDSAAAKAKKGK